MIISHEHRYLFVELPRTGSTAIRRELRELYAGVPILHKHATYLEFERQASEDEKRYFVFSGIRNPLDSVVSRYFKLRTDQGGRFSDTRRQANARGLNASVDRMMYRFLERADADFSTFFLRFYRFPYDTWASLSHSKFDFVIRFERIADDFDTALRMIGLEPVRRLPQRNTTAARTRTFADYYSPRAIQRARRIMGPYMERWGYEFPEAWNIPPPSRSDRLAYQAFSQIAQQYWRHVRPRT